jgi:hypothetical protein
MIRVGRVEKRELGIGALVFPDFFLELRRVRRVCNKVGGAINNSFISLEFVRDFLRKSICLGLTLNFWWRKDDPTGEPEVGLRTTIHLEISIDGMSVHGWCCHRINQHCAHGFIVVDKVELSIVIPQKSLPRDV